MFKLKLVPNRVARLSGAAVLAIAAASTMSGCKQTDITYVSFSPGGGTYAAAQTVSVTLPPKATNVYLTTDSIDPIVDPQCAYAGDNLAINRSTLVKVAYDVAGQHYQVESLYVIENNPVENGYTNRKVMTTWERFFVEHVLRQFNVPNEDTSTLVLDDGAGGKVTLLTNILDRTTLGAPEKGEQTYTFERFKMTDVDNSAFSITINSGKIYGYRDEDEGSYTTKTTGTRGSGERLEFSGTYNGWAEGDFLMNAAGETTSGYYKVSCLDNGCAANPVIYALGTKNQFLQVVSYPDAQTRSCPLPAEPSSL